MDDEAKSNQDTSLDCVPLGHQCYLTNITGGLGFGLTIAVPLISEHGHDFDMRIRPILFKGQSC